MLDEVDDVDDIDDDDDDDDDDRRSLATIIPHELECVEEEDEEQLAAVDNDQVDELGGADRDRADPIDPEREREASQDSHREAIRKQEDLNVGRPRTPEPSFDLRADADIPKDSPSSTISPRNRSGTLLAPASHRSPSSPINDLSMMEQFLQLSMQVSVMTQLTSAMESQHAAAQDTIRFLEAKVGELEKAVQEAKHQPPAVEQDFQSFFTNISSQWNRVRDEWSDEREHIRRTTEDWDSRIINIDTSLERMSHLQNTTTATLVKESSLHKQEMAKVQKELRELQLAGLGTVAAVGVGNGELVHRGSGLVTPPSPRSQSSDSGESARAARRRRRKKRGSLSVTAVGGARARAAGTLREREDETEDVDDALSGSESDVPEVATEGGGTSGVVDAVKVTESPSTTLVEEQGMAATTRAYPLSHYPLLVHAHQKEHYPLLSSYDDTGSSYSSSQFASEEEVEEGKKVPGRPIRIRIPGGRSLTQKTKDCDDIRVTESTVATTTTSENVHTKRPPSVSSLFRFSEIVGTTHDDHENVTVNFQTAGAMVVLVVTAAAVFWKVRSE